MVAELPPLVAALNRVKALEREIAALRASMPASDVSASFVGELLEEAICRATRVRRWREPHPFGSSQAREGLVEAEVPAKVVVDADDAETLPRRVRITLAKEGARVRVTAQLRGDDGRTVTYAIHPE